MTKDNYINCCNCGTTLKITESKDLIKSPNYIIQCGDCGCLQRLDEDTIKKFGEDND